jgi:hypothetical protein
MTKLYWLVTKRVVPAVLVFLIGGFFEVFYLNYNNDQPSVPLSIAVATLCVLAMYYFLQPLCMAHLAPFRVEAFLAEGKDIRWIVNHFREEEYNFEHFFFALAWNGFGICTEVFPDNEEVIVISLTPIARDHRRETAFITWTPAYEMILRWS